MSISTLPIPATPTADHSGPTPCAHCALPVHTADIDPLTTDQFCCHGCRTAHAVIRDCGLERYYHVRDQAQSTPTPIKPTGRRYSELDDPLFATLYIHTHTPGHACVEFYLESVHCAACVWLVERLPTLLPGVIEARLQPREALVRITWDPACLPLSSIARTLDSLGYPPHPARQAGARKARQIEDRRTLIRIAVAGACAGNIMLLALALYAGAFATMESEYLHLFRWVSMALSLVAVAWPGSIFFRGALASIRTRTPNLDLPIALGMGAGLVWSVLNTLRGTGEIYFDSLSVLVFALLVGRAIQQRQQRWSADAVELLFSLTPTSARRVQGDTTTDVPIEALTIGDLVEVHPGESIPADGTVELGTSTIDQSLLTGESTPTPISPGDSIHAGAVNQTALLRIRVLATGEATRVGRLMKMVQEGARRRAPIVRLADRFASWFVLGMLLLSLITAVIWAFIDPARAIDNAAALLIVTCPCALGLATPLAMTVAIGRAAKLGILIKGGDALQTLAGRGTIFLDKTGTLTHARMALLDWLGPEELKPLVAAIEAHSTHPIAHALVRDLTHDPNTPEPTQVLHTPGGGIQAVVGGQRIVVGSPAFVQVRAHTSAPGIAEFATHSAALGHTPILIAIDGRIAAAAALGDALRDEAPQAVAALQRIGWVVRILSGDHPAVVAGIARQLGLPTDHAEGGVTPEEKLRRVAETAKLSPASPVVMVGDGVNDAAALAGATVGIAVRGGAEASLAAADVYLTRPGLWPIVMLASASRRTMGTIRLGLGVSIFYNVLAATLAMTGLLSPIIAAVLMPISSLTVLTLAFKSRTFGGPPCR
ncbi:MAG: heavy metal translocating P-type ATPase [bacterium]